MLDINVKISADDRLVSAIENLAAAISGGSNFSSISKPVVEKDGAAKETKASTQKAKTEKPKTEKPTETVVDEDNTSNEPENDNGDPGKNKTTNKAVTLEDIRPIAKKLVDSGRQGELKAIVSSFTDAEGNPAKSLPKVQKEDFAELFTKIQAAVDGE